MASRSGETSATAGLEAVIRELEKEVALAHLCARGARYATIRSLFQGDVVLAKIKELTKRFHGDRKPSKARRASMYTETQLARRHAGYIYAIYRSLLSSGLPDLQIYVKVDEEYAANPPGGEKYFDVDKIIRLLRGVAMGELRVERCCDCGSGVVMLSDEVNARDECPICNYRKPTRTRAVQDNSVLPPKELIEEFVTGLERNKRLAIELVLAGARPQEVDALVPGHEKYARSLWPILIEKRAPPGSHTFDQSYYTETIDRRRQTSYVVSCYKRLSASGFAGAHLLLALYRDYLQVFSRARELMNFSRIRLIVQLAVTGEFKQFSCPTCHAEYTILKDEIPGDQVCPVCRMIANQKKQGGMVVYEAPPLEVRENGRVVCPLPGESQRRGVTPGNDAKRAT